MRYIILALIGILIVVGCSRGTIPPVEDTNQAAIKEAPKDMPKKETVTEQASARLKSIFSKVPQYKVTYQTSGMTGEGQMTQYFKGSSMRTDMNNMGREMRTYLLEKQLFTCNNAPSGWSCMKVDSAQTTDTESEIKQNIERYRTESLPGRVIAGASTECFKIFMDQGTSEYCYSKEGVPLYVKTESGKFMSEMTAISYSTSVSDSEFNLPAEAKTMPAGYPAGLPEGFPEDFELPEGLEIPDFP